VWRLVGISLATVALWGSWQMLAAPDLVIACSNPTYNLAKDSDVIVEGRYVSYEAGSPHPVALGEQVTETIGFAAARVLKGSVNGTTLTIVDQAWVGGPPSGSCGSAPSDPTGKYSIAGFLKRGDGTFDFYGSFFFGDGPQGPSYDDALSRVASELGLQVLPAVGSKPSRVASPIMTWAVSGLVVAGVISFLVATSLQRRKRS
jgi:hypothetical protein